MECRVEYDENRGQSAVKQLRIETAGRAGYQLDVGNIKLYVYKLPPAKTELGY
jgi:hypothetical protein